MEKHYWFVAQTYVNLGGASVSYFAFREGAYGLHTTSDINDENICYYTTEEEAKKFAYGWANTDRTVHGRYLPEPPKRVVA
jgi:hypothetical protein